MSTLIKYQEIAMRVTAETKTATRQRILDESKRLFANQGFDAATTRDIARAAQIAVGTLFNYFPTKESIAGCLVSEASRRASDDFNSVQPHEPLSLEEELFAHVAAIMRKLKPYRKYLPPVLETTLSPLASKDANEQSDLRAIHLETVCQILSKHTQHEILSATTLQLYWTLYTGVLT